MQSLMRILAAIMLIFSVSACGSGAQSIEELAARERESDANLWDDEDYKSIAAESCILYKTASDKSLGELFGNWDALSIEYTKVGLTAGALEDHPKWGPIGELVFKLKVNAINRSVGNNGVEVPSNLVLQTYALCNELGLDLNK